jgi:4-hydroxy-tetrahydrodipicolinate reductase
MKILLSGCGGAMGRTLTSIIMEKDEDTIVAGVDKFPIESSLFPIYSTFNECNEKCDVIIDFSHPDVLNSLLDYAIDNSLPIVLSTTGHTDEQKEKIKQASKLIPIFMSANMSLGVNLMIELLTKAASFLDGFDIEIIEKHHIKKLDAPSGTALALAEAINNALPEKKEFVYGRHNKAKKRDKNEIGIHAVRGGTIVGEHQVHFIGTDEIIEIRHNAYSKNVFAEGAIRAASYIIDKPAGVYNMKSMLG